MPEIGRTNTLKILKDLDIGLILDGGELGEILLPRTYKPEQCAVGDLLEVFLYLDSEDRLVATTLKPYAMAGEFAHLKAVSVDRIGAFLDWGLPKDLLVPFREQNEKMREGNFYIVYVYLDPASGRIAASSRIERYLGKRPANYKTGQSVELLIAGKTEIGYKAIVDQSHWGILYENEVFKPLKRGDTIHGFIKKVRPDGKIDLSLNKSGYGRVEDVSERILRILKESGGFIPVTDKSPPEMIYRIFGESKKTFKQAVGALYKKKEIVIESQGIRVVSPEKNPGERKK